MNKRFQPRRRMTNKVFLYELSQVSDSNEMRARTYRHVLSDFLGLSQPLDPLLIHGDSESSSSDSAIDICDEKYTDLRAKLVENGKIASKWIRGYFLSLSDVTVSSPEHFEELLLQWSIDPCDDVQHDN